jgi:flagellar biosynthetic protein FliR
VTPALPAIQGLGAQTVAAFLLVLGRLAPLFVLAPMFSSKMVPARVRGIAAVGLAMGMTPVALKGAPLSLEEADLASLLIKEILVGLAFAFAIGAFIAAIGVAGSFLDNSIGFSFGSLVDPLTGSQGTILAQLYGLLGVMIFIAIGGDAWAIQGIARTYELVPLEALPDMRALSAGALDAFVGLSVAAIELAAPILLALLVTDAAFGMVARAVPQVNVFSVGFPAKVLVGLILLAATLPFAATWLADGLAGSISDALRSIRSS